MSPEYRGHCWQRTCTTRGLHRASLLRAAVCLRVLRVHLRHLRRWLRHFRLASAIPTRHPCRQYLSDALSLVQVITCIRL